MARAKRKLPAKPAAFISPHHRGHFCRRHPIPEHKAPPPTTIHTPQKPHDPVKRHRPTPEHKKPAAAPNTAGRFLFSAAPPSLLPPSTDARTQKTRCRSEHRRPFSFLRTTAVTSAAVIRYPNTKPPPPTTIHTPQKPHGPVKRHRPIPEHKKTRCRSEHRRPFPLSLKKPQRCLNAIVQRQPPPAGAQHHLTQPNPNISGRRFTAFFALRCL